MLGGLLTLITGLVVVLSAIGLVRLYWPHGNPAPALTVAGTPEQVARGAHLAASFCASCHSANGELPLTGGVDLFADIPVPLGSAFSANLTPAGRLANYTDGEIFRVLREGVDNKGNPLIMMGIVRVRHMSDDDIHAVIAFLRSQPAVANDVPLPLDQPNFLTAIMGGAGMLPAMQPPVQGPIVAPPAAETVAFGEYNISFQDCRDCHGADLHGGVAGQLPPIGPDLAVVKGWTREQFLTTLRTGLDPSGHQLTDAMPWRQIGLLDDTELGAIFLYLQSLS